MSASGESTGSVNQQIKRRHHGTMIVVSVDIFPPIPIFLFLFDSSD